MCQNILQFSHLVMSNSLQPHGLQHARLPCPSPTPGSLLKLISIKLVVPSNHLILFSFCLQSFPASESFLFFFFFYFIFVFVFFLVFYFLNFKIFNKWVSSSHQVAKVLEFPLQHQSFQWIFRTDFLWDGLFGSPCSPSDSQESSPTSQFKSIKFE